MFYIPKSLILLIGICIIISIASQVHILYPLHFFLQQLQSLTRHNQLASIEYHFYYYQTQKVEVETQLVNIDLQSYPQGHPLVPIYVQDSWIVEFFLSRWFSFNILVGCLVLQLSVQFILFNRLQITQLAMIYMLSTFIFSKLCIRGWIAIDKASLWFWLMFIKLKDVFIYFNEFKDEINF